MKRDNSVIGRFDQKIGDVETEVFKILTDDNAELAVTHFPVSKKNSGNPLVLIHGNFTNRSFWISPKGLGLGVYLAENGYDIWIPDLRGHGLSPKEYDYSSITVEKHLRYDLPAIQNLVSIETDRKALWIGHSFGGIAIIASLAAGWIKDSEMKGTVLFGTQISMGEGYLRIPPLAWLLGVFVKIIGYFPAGKLGFGPENEPAGVIQEFIRWKGYKGKWTTTEGFCYWDGFKGIKVPVLSFAGAGDKNDPHEGCYLFFDNIGSSDKKYILLGKEKGYAADYGHIEMVISKMAQAEVWPLVLEWIREHA